MPIAILLFSAMMVIYGFYLFTKEPENWVNFASMCYTLMFFGGYIAIYIINQYTALEVDSKDLPKLFGSIAGGFFVFVISAKLTARIFKNSFSYSNSVNARIEQGIERQSAGLTALCVLGVLSLISIAAFVSINGLSVGEHDYGYRYEISRGMGPVIFFFPAFLPAGAAIIYKAKGLKGFFISSSLYIGIGIITYMTLAGYRQMLLACILTVVLVGIKRGYIKKALLPGFIIGAMVLGVALSFVRYSAESDSPFSDRVSAAAAFLQGDLFPIIPPLKIEAYKHYHTAPGWDVAKNAMLLYVPRFLWPDKPEITLNAGGFYTQEVLNYNREVTLSPTIVGEALLIGDISTVIVFLIVAGALIGYIDLLRQTTSSAVTYFCILSFQYQCFFMVREGLFVFFAKLVPIAIFAVMAKSMAPFFLKRSR